MRHALEPDQDLYPSEAPTDLVLGAPALLGIFFAIAVVCAVCFGFGYSVHSSPLQARVTPAPTVTHVPRPLGPSPSAARQDTAEANEDLEAPGELSGLPPEPDHTGGMPLTQAKPKPAPAVRLVPQPVTGQSSLAKVPEPSGLAPFEGLMVQIAAVSRASDAQTLAAALRHDGFAAIVRSAAGDPLFHVQVGPFVTREAAKAMRTRLADTGYNAFIKN